MGWTNEQIGALDPTRFDAQRVARGKRILAKMAATPGAVEGFNALTGDQAKALVKQSRARGVAPKEDRTYNGRVYMSKSEALYAAKLDLLIKAGFVSRWTPQVPFRLLVNGNLICKIVVDFNVEYHDGTSALIEVKGHETQLWKVKAKLFRSCYPDLKYTVVKP